MDDPNITMEEYIQLMADKARGRDQTFNWETATYGEVYCEDLDSFTDFETDFLAIVYNDASTSNQNVSSEPSFDYIPKKLEEEYHSIKDDTLLVSVYTTGKVTMKGMLIPDNLITNEIRDTQAYKKLRIIWRMMIENMMRFMKSTILSLSLHKTAKITKEQENMAAVKEKILEEDVENIIEGVIRTIQKKLMMMMRRKRMRKNKRRIEKMQALIPSPIRSPRKDLYSHKTITQELTVFVSPTPATSSQRRSKSISKKYTYITEDLRRICRRQDFMLQHMQKKYVTNRDFQDIKEKVDVVLHEIVPKIASNITNDLINDNLPRIIANAVKKERESSQAIVPALIS
uniref:Uncharacterized protein n=1 Tax=Tanacetum cinerariifolium TaxID=118510 RepID=A0A6L2LKI4_TANCI|nr:hypothetical protein [Tanacetum cinerariifolium]